MSKRIVVATLSLILMSFAIAGERVELPRDEKTGRYTYQEVVKVEGASARDLYSQARAWVARTYVSAQDVVQLEDSDAARLIVKGLWQTSSGFLRPGGWIRHTLTIEAKDGRYRYTISDLILAFDPPTGREVPLEDRNLGIPYSHKYLEDAARDARDTIASLKAAMAKASPAGSDEW